MASTVETRLNDMGITLPDAPAPAANYVPFVKTGNLVFISGQVPFVDGKLTMTGRLGENATVEDGYAQARICAINLIANLKVACDGDLDRVTSVVKLGAFVASADDFNSQPPVVNGASDLMVEAFGDAGRHARFAVGTNALPLGCLVEVDGVFEITVQGEATRNISEEHPAFEVLSRKGVGRGSNFNLALKQALESY